MGMHGAIWPFRFCQLPKVGAGGSFLCLASGQGLSATLSDCVLMAPHGSPWFPKLPVTPRGHPWLAMCPQGSREGPAQAVPGRAQGARRGGIFLGVFVKRGQLTMFICKWLATDYSHFSPWLRMATHGLPWLSHGSPLFSWDLPIGPQLGVPGPQGFSGESPGGTPSGVPWVLDKANDRAPGAP